jgi:hypothetical protein
MTMVFMREIVREMPPSITRKRPDLPRGIGPTDGQTNAMPRAHPLML